MMEPFTLAAALVGILTPLLRASGEAAADRAARRAGEAMGDAALHGATTLWGRLKPSLETRPDVERAIRSLAVDPSSEQARTVLVGQLAVLLVADPELLHQAAAVVEARDRYVASTVDVAGDGNLLVSGEGNITVGNSSGVSIRNGRSKR